MYDMWTWEKVWLVVSQGRLTLLLLVFSPGSTLCADHNQAVHLMSRIWEKKGLGTQFQYPRKGRWPVAQLLPKRPQVPELLPSPSSTAAWKAGLNTSSPGEPAEWKVRWLLSGCVTYSQFPFVLIICGAQHSFPSLSCNKDCLRASCGLYLHPHGFCFFMS